jgi:hypothetical protein
VTGPALDDPRAARRAALRKATLQLVLGVVVLDAVALGIYYLGGIEHGSTPAKQIFTAVWLVATAFTVAVLLKRVRTIRFANPSR